MNLLSHFFGVCNLIVDKLNIKSLIVRLKRLWHGPKNADNILSLYSNADKLVMFIIKIIALLDTFYFFSRHISQFISKFVLTLIIVGIFYLLT